MARAITLALLAVLSLATPSAAAGREFLFIIDCSPSMASQFSAIRTEVTQALKTLPAPACVQVLAVTVNSYGEQARVLKRYCLREREFRRDRGPDDAREQMLADWESRARTLTPTCPGSDILGAITYAGYLLASTNPGAMSVDIAIWTDGRNNQRGINLEQVQMVGSAALEKARQQEIVPSLRGAQVKLLSFHSDGKTPQYMKSLQAFYLEYFKAAGAEVKRFSPLPDWTP